MARSHSGTLRELRSGEKYEWKIKDIMDIAKRKQAILSECFYTDISAWSLALTFTDDNFMLSLTLEELNFDNENFDCLFYYCTISFWTSDGIEEEQSCSLVPCASSLIKCNGKELLKFCSPLNELDRRKSTLLPFNNTLTVICSIKLHDDPVGILKTSQSEIDTEREYPRGHSDSRRTKLDSNPYIGLIKNDFLEGRCPKVKTKLDSYSPDIARAKSYFRDPRITKLDSYSADLKWKLGVIKKKEETPTSKSLKNLVEDFKGLLLSGEDTDVTLSVKGKEFKAHRYILKARSPVLFATFQHDMVEKRTGMVKIDDCDPESFQNFLHFLYTGQTTRYPSSDHVIELYKTAHKYDVLDLQVECVEYMKENLTLENVCGVMSLSLQYDENQLYDVTRKFCIKNSTDVVETSQFAKFMVTNVKAAQKLIVEMCKK